MPKCEICGKIKTFKGNNAEQDYFGRFFCHKCNTELINEAINREELFND